MKKVEFLMLRLTVFYVLVFSFGLFAQLQYGGSIFDGPGDIDGLSSVRSVAVSPDGNYVYSVAVNDNALAIFKKNSDTLDYIACIVDSVKGVDSNNNIDGLYQAISVAVSPDGNYVYAVSNGENAISVFKKNGDTLDYVTCLRDSVNGVDGLRRAMSVTVNPNGNYVYVVSNVDDAISIFKKNGDSLDYVTCLKDGKNGVDGLDGAYQVAVSPDGNHIYAVAYNSDALSVFKRNGDSLDYVTCLKDGKNGVDGLYGAVSVTASSDSNYVYTVSRSENALSVFKRNGDSLDYVMCLKDGVNGVDGLEKATFVTTSFDNDGYVYVSSKGDNSLSIFKRSGDSLNYLACLKDGENGVDGLYGAYSVAASRDDEHIYTAAWGDCAVSVFKKKDDTLDYVTCLKDGQGSSIDGLNGAYAVTASSDGNYVYSVSYNDAAVAVFKKNSNDLDYVMCLKDGENGVDGLSEAYSITVSPDGNYVYVVGNDDAISILKKNGDGLDYVTCLKDGENGVDGLKRARSVTISSTGNYVYVASMGDNAVSVFKKDGDSLEYIMCLKNGKDSVDGLSGANSVAVSPNDDYVYVAAWAGNALSVFKRSGDSLEYVRCFKDSVDSVYGLSGARTVLASPNGDYVYVLASNDSAISVFKNNEDSLEYVACLKDSVDSLGNMTSMAIGPNGNYIYIVSSTNKKISVFRKTDDSLEYITCLEDGENGANGLDGVNSISISPDGNYVYTAAYNDDAVSWFKFVAPGIVNTPDFKQAQVTGKLAVSPVYNMGQLRFFVNVPLSEDFNLSVFNTAGQKRWEYNGKFNRNNITVDVPRANNLSNGFYIVRLTSGNKSINSKFLLVK